MIKEFIGKAGIKLLFQTIGKGMSFHPVRRLNNPPLTTNKVYKKRAQELSSFK